MKTIEHQLFALDVAGQCLYILDALAQLSLQLLLALAGLLLFLAQLLTLSF